MSSYLHIIPFCLFYLTCQVSFSMWIQFSSVAQSCPTLCNPVDCSTPGFPVPSPTPKAYSNSCPSSQWCQPTISSSVVPFSSHLQSFPASGSFLVSQFFALPSFCCFLTFPPQWLVFSVEHTTLDFQFSFSVSTAVNICVPTDLHVCIISLWKIAKRFVGPKNKIKRSQVLIQYIDSR